MWDMAKLILATGAVLAALQSPETRAAAGPPPVSNLVADPSASESIEREGTAPPRDATPDERPPVILVCPDGSGNYLTIQEAIDAAPDGAIVELCDYTYTGDGNRDLDFGGKAITVCSESHDPSLCIIDAYESLSEGHRGFHFHTGEGSNSVVEGITIRNRGFWDEVEWGGGIYCEDTSPTITNCRFERCNAVNGGGIYVTFGSPTITGCEFSDCFAGNDGGAIYSWMAYPVITGCFVAGNDTTGYGGGILAYYGSPTITWCTITGNYEGGIALMSSYDVEISHCTIAGNHAGYGGGIFLSYASATVENSIIWGNCMSGGGYSADDVYVGLYSGISFACCDVDRSKVDGDGAIWWFDNNIEADPLFCDPADCEDAPTAAGDYHLRSNSPCAPEQQPVCGLIGALGEGDCPWTHVVCPDDSGDFVTIQEAIDAAYDGDIVELCDDTFTGTGNRAIDYLGKAITVRSESGDPTACIIDCEAAARGFSFQSGETADSVLENVTIRNGYRSLGAGIYCVSSSPTIRGCVIAGNNAWHSGGGINLWGSSATIVGCTVAGNEASGSGPYTGRGGGIYCYNSAPNIAHCTITGNQAWGDNDDAGNGGGIYTLTTGATPEFVSCTISGNRASHYGGGIYGACVPRRSIVWDNCALAGLGSDWYANGGCGVVGCCDDLGPGLDGFDSCVYDCGQGPNLSADPLFSCPLDCNDAPTAEGCFHLGHGSPCASQEQPECGLIGALCYAGDVDRDFDVDLGDLAALLASYGKCPGDPGYAPRTEFDCAICTSLEDLAFLLSNYGQSCP